MAEPEPDNNKPPLGPEKFQSMVRWIIMIFLGYVLVHNALDRHNGITLSNSLAPPPTQTLASKVNCDKKFPLFNISLIPLYVPTLKTQDVKTGTGEPAACGQKASFRYEYAIHNKTLKQGKKSIVIGDGTDLHGTELGLLGMEPGGIRKIIMPPQLAVAESDVIDVPADLKDQMVTAKLSLDKLSPSLPSSPMPLRAIDTVSGNDKEVQCGDIVNATITLWKMDGTELSSPEKPISFALGKSTLPYGIEAGVLGMREGGSRIIVIPPGSFTEPLIKSTGTATAPLTIPANTIVIAQIEQLHIENEQDKPFVNPFVTEPPAAEEPKSRKPKTTKP